MRQLKISTDRLTRRTENTSRYFTEVERKKILSSDEEVRIGRLAQEGDENAIHVLIQANLRFVISVAKQYSNAKVPLDDLICQGNIGLCDAARSFDPSRGFKFISYAVWHIRKEILSYLNSDYRVVRVPQNVLNDLTKIRRIDESLLQHQGRPGTPEELEVELEKIGKPMTVDHIKKIAFADALGIPLESNDPDQPNAPIDWLHNEYTASSIVDTLDLDEVVKIALSRLTIIQQDIVVRRLGIGGIIPENFSTISERYDRTPEWARALYTKSLRIMKSKLNRANLTQDKILNHEI